MREYIIDGKAFRTPHSFYQYAQDLFTFNLNRKTTDNLDVINDFIYGGFGQHDYLESIKVIWINSEISKRNLTNDFYNSINQIFEEAENVTFEQHHREI